MINCIVLTKNANTLLRTCIGSFIKYNTDVDVVFNIGDTGTNKNDLISFEKFLKDNNVKYKLYKGLEYNFAKNCNFLVKNIDNNYENLLFLNDDVEFVQPIIKDMFDLLNKDRTIGTVGCKLLFDDVEKNIQCAGIFFQKNNSNRGWDVGQIGLGYKSDEFSKNKPDFINVFGNTAACLLMYKQTFVNFGMFNEKYKVCFEDVELGIQCIKISKKNVCILNKYALHKESYTRKMDVKNQFNIYDDIATLNNIIRNNCLL